MCSQVAERSTVADRKGKKGGFWLGAVDRWTRGGRPLAAAEGLVQRRKGLSSRRQGPNELKVAWCDGGAVRKLKGCGNCGRNGVVERHTPGPLTLLGLSPRITKPLTSRASHPFSARHLTKNFRRTIFKKRGFHLISHHLSKDGAYIIFIEERGRGRDSLEIQGS